MTTQHIETLIIGAGQAGLSTGYHLQRQGRPFLIVDGNERVGDNWRQQWDTLRLYTPAKYDGLPGLPFPAPAWHFPTKDDVADYLERYALHFDLPIRMSTPVDRLSARAGEASSPTSDATRSPATTWWWRRARFGRTPYVPDFAAELDPSIAQLHSSEYRRAVPAPATGPSSSWVPRTPGTDVAYEVARDPRRRSCAVATAARSRSGSSPAGRTWSSRSSCSRSATCSPGARRSAARRWTRSASTAARCSASSARTWRPGRASG